ncbi:DUF2065 domain-containing protein [Alteromonadaceae bacterium M269]|nr:DUF2065 domain-containing protein [Alteromonadaceae bacterium M269]
MSDNLFIVALAIALILEGIGPLLFPNAWQRYLKQISVLEPSHMRRMGGVLVTIGAVCLWYLL